MSRVLGTIGLQLAVSIICVVIYRITGWQWFDESLPNYVGGLLVGARHMVPTEPASNRGEGIAA